MNEKPDLTSYKATQREMFKQLRKNMSPEVKQQRDQAILQQLLSTAEYKSSRIILLYISSEIEVDTMRLMAHAEKDDKTIAVPYCIHNTRELKFYKYDSDTKLQKNKIGIMEPVPDEDKLITNFHGSLCVVPALSCDHDGFRLGYGGGYYDRFLSKYDGSSVAIVYSDCMIEQLNRESFDMPVDTVITDKQTWNIKGKKAP